MKEFNFIISGLIFTFSLGFVIDQIMGKVDLHGFAGPVFFLGILFSLIAYDNLKKIGES